MTFVFSQQYFSTSLMKSLIASIAVSPYTLMSSIMPKSSVLPRTKSPKSVAPKVMIPPMRLSAETRGAINSASLSWDLIQPSTTALIISCATIT